MLDILIKVHHHARSLEEKLSLLRSQLEHLRDGTDPEFQQAVCELESIRDNRLFVAGVFRQYELSVVQQEFEREQAIAVQRLGAKRQDLKECILQDLQDKRKAYDTYRHGMEVSSICKLSSTSHCPGLAQPVFMTCDVQLASGCDYTKAVKEMNNFFPFS